MTVCFQMQLRKEGRRNEYERHKLQALNQRQKMVRISRFKDICVYIYDRSRYLGLLEHLNNLEGYIYAIQVATIGLWNS